MTKTTLRDDRRDANDVPPTPAELLESVRVRLVDLDAQRQARGIRVEDAHLFQVACRQPFTLPGKAGSCSVVVLMAGERDDVVAELLELRRRVDRAERDAATLADKYRARVAQSRALGEELRKVREANADLHARLAPKAKKRGKR